MIAQLPAQMICYPPAALNGGPLETAPPKVGEWVWQPKVDDWRAVVHTPTRTVWNQYGRLSSFTDTDKFTVALDTLQRLSFSTRQVPRFDGHYTAEWLDVGMMENRHDLMRGCIIVFDVIEAGLEFMQRRARLRSMFPVLPFDVSRLLSETGGQVRDSVYLVSQWDNKPEPLKLYTWLQQENDFIGHNFYEGLVAKRVNSLYQFGRKPKQESPDWIKHRFDQGLLPDGKAAYAQWAGGQP